MYVCMYDSEAKAFGHHNRHTQFDRNTGMLYLRPLGNSGEQVVTHKWQAWNIKGCTQLSYEQLHSMSEVPLLVLSYVPISVRTRAQVCLLLECPCAVLTPRKSPSVACYCLEMSNVC